MGPSSERLRSLSGRIFTSVLVFTLGIVLVFACVGVVGLIFGDLLMVLLDPRISFGSKGGNR